MQWIHRNTQSWYFGKLKTVLSLNAWNYKSLITLLSDFFYHQDKNYHLTKKRLFQTMYFSFLNTRSFTGIFIYAIVSVHLMKKASVMSSGISWEKNSVFSSLFYSWFTAYMIDDSLTVYLIKRNKTPCWMPGKSKS